MFKSEKKTADALISRVLCIGVKVWQACESCSVTEEDAAERHEAHSVQHGADVISTPRQQL